MTALVSALLSCSSFGAAGGSEERADGGPAVPSPDAAVVSDASFGSFEDASSAPSLPDGLIGYWPFDEGDGGTAHDHSGHSHVGTINGASWTEGRYGGALRFDGVDDYVRVNPGPTLGGRYTIALWVQLETVPTGEVRLISRMEGTLTIRVDEGGYWSFHWNHVSGDSTAIRGSIKAEKGWHHLAVTHDGTTAKLFVDHALATSAAETTQEFKARGMDIGGNAEQRSEFANATIDEVRFYGRALSESEIAQL